MSEKQEVEIKVEFKDHNKVVLIKQNGDTYTSKSEDLMDFLHGINKVSLQSSDLTRLQELNELLMEERELHKKEIKIRNYEIAFHKQKDMDDFFKRQKELDQQIETLNKG